MWLPIVISLLALALIVGPIMLMQPTALQRRLANLRRKAAQEGLRVHLQALPRAEKSAAASKNSVAYCLPWEKPRLGRNEWALLKKSYTHELHIAQVWQWVKHPAPGSMDLDMLGKALESAPARVLALQNGPQGLCCFWSESGTELQVVELADWLQSLATAISNGSAVRHSLEPDED